MSVNDFQKDPAVTEAKILEQAKIAVEQDGADVVILGCTIEFGFYRKIQAEIGVPVLDALVAPLRYAEMLAELQSVQGWAHSKRRGYQRPVAKELDAWIPATAPVVSVDPRP